MSWRFDCSFCGVAGIKRVDEPPDRLPADMQWRCCIARSLQAIPGPCIHPAPGLFHRGREHQTTPGPKIPPGKGTCGAGPRFLHASRAVRKLWTIGTSDMLSWALAFLVVALIAAFFGFSGVASASAGIAKILFVIFLVLFLVSLLSQAL
jgi:uncharacterized membrane protein YtjA (UPF0391 family)